LLIIYTLATGMKPSAVRACVMAIIFWSAPLFGRKPDAPSAFALAAIVLLLFEPAQLFDAGFIFSFVIVAGLLLLVPRCMEICTAWLKPDPWQLETGGGLRRLVRSGWFGVASLLAVSTAAWLFSAPLTATFFNLVAPVALVGNLGVVPMAFVVVLTGCLSLVFGSLSSVMAEVFNHANRLFVTWLLSWIELLNSLPGGHWFTRSPSWWVFIIWYGSLEVGLIGFRSRRWSRMLCLVGLISAGILTVGPQRPPQIDVLDVGNGSAVLVDLPAGGDVLFDAGPAYRVRAMIRHLKASGVNRVQALILSHPDARHVAGALDVLRIFRVDEIWCSPYAGRSSVYNEVLSEAERRGVPVVVKSRGDRGTFKGSDASWEVLHPSGMGRFKRADQASLVIKVDFPSLSVLLMGGAGGEEEADMLAAGVATNTDVLVVGNQARVGSCSEAWLEAVDPRQMILNLGRGHPRGTTSRDLLFRAEARGVELSRTDRDGTVTVR
jgi:competence protein ComEC